MIELTLGEIAAIVDGRLDDADPVARLTASVEFDSRRIEPGGLFVAFAGEQVDGHDFVAAAVDAGAVAAIVTKPVGRPGIIVADPLTALADLARAVLVRLPDLRVVGVTGSSGKTSTKDLIATLLSELGATVAPPGSFNNELGHPYTVLRAEPTTRFLVLEYSARGIGHIRYLAEVARPRIGVVLNVGSAHLGEFGSRAAIAAAKGELIEALPSAQHGGVAVLNGDDHIVTAMAARTSARVIRFGRGEGADVRASEVRLDELGRPRFVLAAAGHSVEVALRLTGEHQVSNALAAAAVALECGLGLDQVATVLGRAEARSRWRMELRERSDGVVVLNDAYNANPESMRAALATLAAMGSARPTACTWAVLGPMAELGRASAAEHEALGRLVADLHISRLVAVGEQARPIVDTAVLESLGGWPAGKPQWVADADSATRLVHDQLRPGDVVLVKASRAAGLERVALALTGEGSDGEDHA